MEEVARLNKSGNTKSRNIIGYIWLVETLAYSKRHIIMCPKNRFRDIGVS